MAMTQLGLGSTVPQIIQEANANLAELDSGKADKVTNGKFHDIAILDADGNLATSARTIDSLEHQINEISLNKADKVSGATSGHLAALDSGGNLTDSGKSINDIVSAEPIATFTAAEWGTSLGIPSIFITSDRRPSVAFRTSGSDLYSIIHELDIYSGCFEIRAMAAFDGVVY